MHDELVDVPRRLPDIDLALLHPGGTRVLGITLTVDAEQEAEAVELFDADVPPSRYTTTCANPRSRSSGRRLRTPGSKTGWRA